ncbi:class I SAM-dependent methyltransferase [Nonomuraea sp. FMUSA5-5]|uniref:Class I SAM-dependent methyltransferase n=1 Tax=Nonomuraea composti TaxID=2720023 RepID=A0ABX1BK17_9ACTN|nr:class I SAM-dependent methyltransferase [Nonomuraea sp. FMUSA5-5]NJP96899.1 class I SAM-dependent methyltransferase [Nonomuraea sp. FMUSA5-5]
MTKTGKGYKGIGMEGPIARWYDTNNGKAPDRYDEQVATVRRHAPKGSRILEVAPGPGYLSIALARTGDYTVTGLDISETFVAIAQGKALEAGVPVDFRHGNASDMPFADGAFDFLICCAAFKNFADPAGALREMRRVLRDGGSGLIVDLRRDVSKEAVEQDVARMGMGVLSRAFTTFALRRFLPRRAYTKAGFEALVSKAGFGSYEVRQTPMALEVELRK